MAADDIENRIVPRISSGTPHLDTVLGGGWLRGGLYVIAGPPGSGKTTLANQFCFAEAGRGEQAVYITMLAETHARMLLHLRSMEFFRPEFIGDKITYLSGAGTVKNDGLSGLLSVISRTVRERNAKALVIDGMAVVREYAKSRVELREFLQGLASHMALLECTTLLLSTEMDKGADVEHEMVDGILALSADLHGLKATRGIEVIKIRGSENLPGKHTFLIDKHGFRVFPRFEALYTSNAVKPVNPEVRLPFGLPRLDEMCSGGLVEHSSTLVLGSPGSGKTLIGMHFLAEGAARGEPGLYFGFAENAEQLIRKCTSVSLKIRPLVENGSLRIDSRAPVETLPDALAQELIHLVEKHGFRRVFLDGLEPFAKEALDAERTTRFIAALLNALRDRGVTILVAQQTNELFGPELHAPVRGVEAICDNVIFLRFSEIAGRLVRLISVLKMRDSVNDPFLRELRVTSDGLEIHDGFPEVEAIMTGQTRTISRANHRSSPRKRSSGSSSRKPPRTPKGRGRRR